MYRLLLAEDEPEVLQGMLSAMRWEEHGFLKPEGCRDGREAIELLEEGFTPDAVITDICMPFVDGLALAGYLNEKLPDTVVVMLTGYDDFNYAHKAIKLQVYDYVLKPVTPAGMNKLLDRLRGELDKRGFSSSGGLIRIAGNQFLNDLLNKRLDTVTIEEWCRMYKLEFVGRYHVAEVLDIDLPSPTTVEEVTDCELMRYGLFNIACELCEREPGVRVFQANDGISNIIVSSADREGANGTAGRIARRISKTASDCLKIGVSAGIGEAVAYLGELHASRAQAVTALGYRFFYGESSVIFSLDSERREEYKGIDFVSHRRTFESAVRRFDKQGAKEAVKAFTEQLRSGQLAVQQCVLLGQKLLMALINLAAELVDDKEAEKLEKLFEGQDILSVTTVDTLERLILDLCDSAFALFDEIKSYAASTIIMKAEQYIRENYSNPGLSLNTITEHLAMSTSYFSSVFKAKTGQTFVEYLTRVRMEKARQILALSDSRTYEVAEAVGFTDPHYFSIAFKRVTGMSPREYRESVGGGRL